MVANFDRREAPFRPRDFTDILTTPWVFRPVTLFIYLAITLLPTTASELGRLAEPSLVVAAGVAAVSVAAVGLLLFIAKIALPAKFRSSLTTVLLVLFTVGALRGTFVSLFMDVTDLETISHLSSRLFLATFSLPPVLALVSLVVSRLFLSKERATSTQTEISAIENRRDLILGEISASDTQLLNQVDGTLRPAVESLSRQITDDPTSRDSVTTALKSLATDVIRPLSHTLASSVAPARTARVPLRVQLVQPAAPTFRDQVSPTFVGLGVFLGAGTVLLDLLPLANAVAASVVSGLVVFTVLRLVVALFGATRWPALGVAATYAVVLSLAWIPAHRFNQAFLFPDGIDFDAGFMSFIALPALAALYQLIVLSWYSGRTQLARLDNTRRNMAFQLSEARRRAWLRQRHLTHTLHSSVQSRVLAESRLVGSGSGSLDSAEQQRTLATLGLVLETVDSDPLVTIDALEKITNIVAFWSGMCQISLAVKPDLLSTVDPETAESVLIVTSEMISNAISHGTATTMSIQIQRDSPDTIRITAANNGRRLDDDHRPGLGMSLYDELSVEWRILPREPVTVVALVAARGNSVDRTSLETIGRTGRSV
ncbi:MAG: hypothetical protein NWS64_01265 [Microbacteriaceae bacterium]|nr:hypothetical protein [Microbacteriaceae bacterium]